ncbi:MFS transporter [Goodfellowiella coeruleoviolacea]|uniref:Drug resistance transporter, EmrB/QacA subfamily n=1 Tax=Goodfellowiella coeruleoviolacea TaxID=334858 RepID=A0AAE3GCI7_9PSEU|nr:MFS transporter [Goodfellowiella coeruleoviolacea]MCP2163663.1 drug resistance transporter, EmrB/QacA subfamily [Goodfellowiella coeruleoviolacea]
MTTPPAQHQRTPDQGARPRWRLTAAVAVLAQTLVSMDSSVLNLAAVTLADPVTGLGATPAELEWSISAYTLVFAAAMFAGGALGDRHGPRATLVAGLLVFAAGSAAAALAPTPLALILARGVMGVGGALLMPATLSIVIRAAPADQRPRAIAWWASAAAAGIAVGPVVGGALLTAFWWGSVFLVNLPVVALCLVAIAGFVPRLAVPTRRRLDAPGLLLSFVGLFCLVHGILSGQRDAWGRPEALAGVAVGLLVLVVFVVVQARSATPSFEVRLFTRRRFTGGSLGLLFAFFGVSGQLFYASFYLQGVLDLSPLAAGTAVAPTAAGIVVGNLTAPALVRRFSVRSVAVVGMLAGIATFASYLLFDQHTPIGWFVLLMLVQGAAMGLVTVPTTTASLAELPPERSGAGSAVNSAMRQVGATLGVAVLGAVLAASYRTAIAPALAGLPETARSRASTSAEATRFVADALGRPDLADAADTAFLHAMHVTSAWTAGLCLIGAAVLLVCLRPPSTPE